MYNKVKKQRTKNEKIFLQTKRINEVNTIKEYFNTDSFLGKGSFSIFFEESIEKIENIKNPVLCITKEKEKFKLLKTLGETVILINESNLFCLKNEKFRNKLEKLLKCNDKFIVFICEKYKDFKFDDLSYEEIFLNDEFGTVQEEILNIKFRMQEHLDYNDLKKDKTHILVINALDELYNKVKDLDFPFVTLDIHIEQFLIKNDKLIILDPFVF